MRTTVGLLGGWVVTALLLAGCGGSAAERAPESVSTGSQLLVEANDISFPADRYGATSGTIDVSYENDGSITHTLVIEDVQGFKLTVKSHGDVDEATVELEPGEYTLYCDVPGHRQAGMEATLTVS